MRYEEFVRQLREAGGYETPAGPNAPPGCFAATACYHARAAGIVWHGWRRARRGRFDTPTFGDCAFRTLQAVEACGGRVSISGLEHLAALRGPAVFIGNHMSTLETFMLPGLLLPFARIAFVVKESLQRYPFFGPIMRSTAPITVTRRNPREDFKQVLALGGDRLRSGVSVVLFPQATRQPVFNTAVFNTMGTKLAARSGVPVVPLALRTDFLGIGWPVKELGPVYPARTVHYRFGAPIRVEGNGRAQHEAVVAFISGCMREWGVPIVSAAAAGGDE